MGIIVHGEDDESGDIMSYHFFDYVMSAYKRQLPDCFLGSMGTACYLRIRDWQSISEEFLSTKLIIQNILCDVFYTDMPKSIQAWWQRDGVDKR